MLTARALLDGTWWFTQILTKDFNEKTTKRSVSKRKHLPNENLFTDGVGGGHFMKTVGSPEYPPADLITDKLTWMSQPTFGRWSTVWMKRSSCHQPIARLAPEPDRFLTDRLIAFRSVRWIRWNVWQKASAGSIAFFFFFGRWRLIQHFGIWPASLSSLSHANHVSWWHLHPSFIDSRGKCVSPWSQEEAFAN